jgi:DNA-binding transcriptional regulator YiaG
MSIKQAIHYHTDADFAKLGLNRNTIKNWEDGKRCVETPISFEW